MNLNQFHRDAFVLGVLRDTPKVDYQPEFSRLVRDSVAKRMPKELRAIAHRDDVSPWLETHYFTAGGNSGLHSVQVFTTRGGRYHDFSGEPEIKKVIEKAREQQQAREHLKLKLEAMIKPCRTLKQAKLMIPPELHGYLPSPEAKSENLPAVTGLMEDLHKMGWPDEKKAA